MFLEHNAQELGLSQNDTLLHQEHKAVQVIF